MSVNNDYPTFYYRVFCNYLMIDPLPLQCVGVTLMLFHYLVYAVNGVGLKRTKVSGRVLESLSELLFVLLLILLAKV